jgi:hypothetical protein
VYYRFRSSTKGDIVAQSGCITVWDLKVLIIKKENLTCDLELVKAESGISFDGDSVFVNNNSSVVAIRKPFKHPNHAYHVFKLKNKTVAEKYLMAKNPPPPEVHFL